MAAAGSSKDDGANIGRISLILAAIIAVVAIGFAIARSTGLLDSAPETPAATTQQTTAEQAIAQLEARLKEKPDDVEGWQMLGWSFFETGRYAEAATAYRKAIALSPNNGELWSALGEALVMAGSDKQMPADAVKAFETAIAKSAQDPRARYFLAVNKDLKGDHKGAIDDWFALLKDTPAGAPWEADLRRTIEQVAEREKIDVRARLAAITPAPAPAGTPEVATDAIPGPSREQMAAATKLPPGQQEAMVRGMVDGLAARLAQNPRDVDGWIRLMRSRMVLGEGVQAKAALDTALKTFGNAPAERDRLLAAAKELGVPGA
ncbi:tetratricopeptide repeat protein [Sphingomonas sp. LaA6.9]|uniref:tetratricopeptide repeat protein n=1 Tax=Sphingomonas sp. LaA6.9 TaxID=2919914 RepID=UPI001F4FAF2E|nr:tetratricopeptide repeat protein [Sphingomonas sp. LaA6.9]MCJ8155878.1 tetratricopeptide repeat protein [Sphingomonas sp. LaA6.9]